jgi:hypothetical protein
MRKLFFILSIIILSSCSKLHSIEDKVIISLEDREPGYLNSKDNYVYAWTVDVKDEYKHEVDLEKLKMPVGNPSTHPYPEDEPEKAVRKGWKINDKYKISGDTLFFYINNAEVVKLVLIDKKDTVINQSSGELFNFKYNIGESKGVGKLIALDD